jgi:predicted O-linked N-acetylglucosamine transferase (SPINDLY family)
MPTISEALAVASVHQQAGRLALAEEIYRRILAVEPEHAEAHKSLGDVLLGQGKVAEAVASQRRALALKPDLAEAHNSLANALKDLGDLEGAVAGYRRALERLPDQAEIHSNLGAVLHMRGSIDEATACYRRALELKPNHAEAHNNLGVALQALGRLAEAAASFRRALEIKPDYPGALLNLGNAWIDLGQPGEAASCFRRALTLSPLNADVLSRLGWALHLQGKLDEAIGCYEQALRRWPDHADTCNNLGHALRDAGQSAEAIACYRRAVALAPDRPLLGSSLLYGMQFCPEYTAETILDAHRRWSQQHAEPLTRLAALPANDGTPDRPLRIGYVSPDFRRHVVGQFLAPLLAAHDHRQFQIYGYSSVQLRDTLTDSLRASVDVWRSVVGLSDAQLADVVRQDRIDILVDLTMHMAGSRLLLFARRAAPVQVTYLAYCGTTGLTAMDYRLTDPYLDPPGSESFYTEQSIRLPETYWCYRPIGDTPPIVPTPAAAAGRITFGSLNNFSKVSQAAIAVWCRVLQAVPASRLLLYSQAGSHRDRVRECFARQDVSPDRVEFVDFQPLDAYFRTYQRIDIALDPFPYGGGTTTCDALWMGVPVVSLAGQTAVGRGGLSILSNLGLQELVARDADGYVRIAAQLAGDLPRLAELRATLRERMQRSPLMDAPRFARNVEAAYREMWGRWCEKTPGTSAGAIDCQTSNVVKSGGCAARGKPRR